MTGPRRLYAEIGDLLGIGQDVDGRDEGNGEALNFDRTARICSCAPCNICL